MSVEPSETCRFEHPVFRRLTDVVFRPAEADGTPVMIVEMGRSSGAVPLRSLQAELGVENASPDGQMFAMVAKALDFVPELRPGDGLPQEVRDGGASWQPSPAHQQAAIARLKLRLVASIEVPQPGARVPDWRTAEPQAVLAAIDAPGMPARLDDAIAASVAGLSLPNPAALARLLDDAAKELAYVEALRDRLRRRVLRMQARAQGLQPGLLHNIAAVELVNRVIRLMHIAVGKTEARFDAIDAGLRRLPDALAELELHRPGLRLHRDWLYCSLRAWEPILSAWEAAGPLWTDATLPLLGRSYRFLAPRFMPVEEWQPTTRARCNEPGRRLRMVW